MSGRAGKEKYLESENPQYFYLAVHKNLSFSFAIFLFKTNTFFSPPFEYYSFFNYYYYFFSLSHLTYILGSKFAVVNVVKFSDAQKILAKYIHYTKNSKLRNFSTIQIGNFCVESTWLKFCNSHLFLSLLTHYQHF